MTSLGSLLGAALLLTTQVAAGTTPTVVLQPDSGGPGTKAVLRGTGFCGAPSCGTVRVTMGGYQVAGDLRPDAVGAFTARFVVPGGLRSGEIYVIATQLHDDGNQGQAMAGFVYAPSKGEAAERKAAEAETLQQLADPTRPAAHRGLPIASAAAGSGVSPSRPAGTPQSAVVAFSAEDRADRWWPYAVTAGAVAVAVAVVLLLRRRSSRIAERHLRR